MAPAEFCGLRKGFQYASKSVSGKNPVPEAEDVR